MNSKTMNGDERCIQETSFRNREFADGKKDKDWGENILFYIHIFGKA